MRLFYGNRGITFNHNNTNDLNTATIFNHNIDHEQINSRIFYAPWRQISL
jgi:hypothetical protein